jgi:hypothetical protein
MKKQLDPLAAWQLVPWSPVVLGPWIGPPHNVWYSYVVLPRPKKQGPRLVEANAGS